jgi:CubicO group peptidase (beta-lactamase class C family)
MTDSYFMLPADKMPRLAQGIDNNNKDRINLDLPVRELKGRGYRVPNGGIYSTPIDLARYVLSLTGINPVLKPESLREMRVIPPGGVHYGLGLVIADRPGLKAIEHDGSVPGYTSAFCIEQQPGGYGVILMRNYNNGSTNLGKVCTQVIQDLKN